MHGYPLARGRWPRIGRSGASSEPDSTVTPPPDPAKRPAPRLQRPLTTRTTSRPPRTAKRHSAARSEPRSSRSCCAVSAGNTGSRCPALKHRGITFCYGPGRLDVPDPPICVAAGSAALIRCGAQIGSIWGGGNAGRIKGGAFMLGERMRQARRPDASRCRSGSVAEYVMSVSAKPRLAGRQPSSAVGCPG